MIKKILLFQNVTTLLGNGHQSFFIIIPRFAQSIHVMDYKHIL
jgi:hypothetical protein